MPIGKQAAALLMRSPVPLAIFVAANLAALAQSAPLERESRPGMSLSSYVPEPHTPMKQKAHLPITVGQRFRWFVASTVGPSHTAGVVSLSAGGTALNRPSEYSSHWAGFGHRLGINFATGAAGSAIETAGGLPLHEDPRYFRVSQEPFKTRATNVLRMTFLSPRPNGRLCPAYARYAGIFGSNFLSDPWRVHSEASPQAALLRSAEGFGGRVAANAFSEFWPDVKRQVFHRNRSAFIGNPQ
jgi:hypothetical protein